MTLMVMLPRCVTTARHSLLSDREQLHMDPWVDPSVGSLMPHSSLSGDANLLVCPNMDAANIAYNLLKTAAGGNIAIGPVLLGAAKPVHILTASTTVRRIVNMTALTVADANAARSNQTRQLALT